MADITAFFWSSLAGGGISSALIAIAAVLGKSQLAHWLNKDIESIKARHSKELEAEKARYERELEAYRTSLIAQAEAIKASQDVRKAIALKVAQRHYEVVERLYSAYSGLGLELEAMMMSWDLIAKEACPKLEKLEIQLAEARSATKAAAPHLHASNLQILVDFNNIATIALSKLSTAAGMSSKDLGLESNISLISLHRPRVDVVIDHNLRAMRDMRDSPAINMVDSL